MAERLVKMQLIDIDRLEEIESFIHYRKNYKASAIIMAANAQIERYDVKFSIEFKPLGDPDIKVNFETHPHFPVAKLIKKMKDKIQEMNSNGSLSSNQK